MSKITGVRYRPENILFSFEYIQGFPVSYDHWCFMLNDLFHQYPEKSIVESFTELISEIEKEGEGLDNVLQDWKNSQNLDDYLQRYVFVERNQVVVPSLNLKAAKNIICRNEHQKKKLRRMGFIEDRIKIQNWKSLW